MIKKEITKAGSNKNCKKGYVRSSTTDSNITKKERNRRKKLRKIQKLSRKRNKR